MEALRTLGKTGSLEIFSLPRKVLHLTLSAQTLLLPRNDAALKAVIVPLSCHLADLRLRSRFPAAAGSLVLMQSSGKGSGYVPACKGAFWSSCVSGMAYDS